MVAQHCPVQLCCLIAQFLYTAMRVLEMCVISVTKLSFSSTLNFSSHMCLLNAVLDSAGLDQWFSEAVSDSYQHPETIWVIRDGGWVILPSGQRLGLLLNTYTEQPLQ